METVREAYVASLRALADFLDETPEVPVVSHQFDVFVKDKAALATIARAATWQKGYAGDWFFLRREFGSITLDVNIERGQVCRRIVTGTEIVPAKTVEIVEWVCEDPLLAGR